MNLPHALKQTQSKGPDSKRPLVVESGLTASKEVYAAQHAAADMNPLQSGSKSCHKFSQLIFDKVAQSQLLYGRQDQGSTPAKRSRLCSTQLRACTCSSWNLRPQCRQESVPNSPKLAAKKKGNEITAIQSNGLYLRSEQESSSLLAYRSLYILQPTHHDIHYAAKVAKHVTEFHRISTIEPPRAMLNIDDKVSRVITGWSETPQETCHGWLHILCVEAG